MVSNYQKYHPSTPISLILNDFLKKSLSKWKTIEWAKVRRTRDDLNLKNIEHELANLEDEDGRGFEGIQRDK